MMTLTPQLRKIAIKKRASNHSSIHNTSRYNSQNRNSNYQNRQKNYSQSPHRNNTRSQNSQQHYGSSTPKHQRQINQVQTNEETQPDPPGIDNTESIQLQLNNKNCEPTDSESETENTISINMSQVEDVYEPIIYEQPKHSQYYGNDDHFLLNYYTRPINKNKTKEQIVEEKIEEKPIESSSTNHIYQNVSKESQLSK